MAKNSIRDYSATNSSNTDIQSIDISEGCSPAGINNAIREVMADLKDVSTGAIALESPAFDSASLTGDLTFGDSDKAVFGAGSDLQIYHDGSSSRIVDAGTGNLLIQADELIIRNAAGNETKADYTTDGAVNLYHDNAAKLATTATGVNVTGALTTTAGATIAGGDLVLDEGSPEIIFQTGASHYNWMIAAQENVSNTLEISSGSQDGDYSNDTFTPRLVVNSSGHVGINATGPIYPLVVVGNAANHVSAFHVATNGYAAALFYDASNTFRGQIQVGSGGTGYLTVSDYRLKTAVNYDFDATTRLKQLRPARFEWTADGDDAVPVDGFLAHEVQDIVPEAISGTKDAMMDEEYEVTPAVLDDDGNEVTPAVMGTRSVPDYQGIDQSKLVPLLCKTILELEARITALEAA